MNDLQSVHPSTEQLSAFGLGHLDEASSTVVAAHVATCADCCKFLESLHGDNFVAQLRAAAEQETAPGSPCNKGALADAPTLAHPLPSTGQADAAIGTLPPELVHHPRYRILQVLGTGGMGTVYKAEHQLMERLVALKVIRGDLIQDSAAVERFRREVKAAARLTHPNIVHAYDAEQAGNLHFLVMEYVEGTSLDRVVADGSLPVARACEYIRQAALGLQHAFERGMVHRDVKPHNLMRTPDGTIKILDFGLARFAQESGRPTAASTAAAANLASGTLTQTGSLMGTPDYMAPEQAANAHEADIRADVYSLGCTLYFLLTGHAPFSDVTGLDKIMAHLDRMPEPLTRFRSDAPPGLAGVLERMLAKSPAARYQTPSAAAAALEPCTHPAEVPEQTPTEQSPQTPPQGPPPGRWLRRLLGGLGGAAVLGGLVLLAQNDDAAIRERMSQVYLISAVLGGTLLLCQLLLSLLGLGHHHDMDAGGEAVHDFGGHEHHAGGHDADHDAQESWFAGMLTFRTIVAALVFFGLSGKAADASGLDAGRSLAVALAAAAASMFLIAWMMRTLHRLRADGTVRIDRAIGRTGTVYLTIPGNKAGLGKVTLNVQNRTVEYQAVTAHQSLVTGQPVVVLAVVNTDTVEVALATSPERITHV